MKIIPITLRKANEFVKQYHRHNKNVTGHKFSIGLEKDNQLIGVAIAGRPVARLLDNGKNIEIVRVCVKEGFKNACSILYARIRRVCQQMGYEKIITYTLQKESQSSLKAIGAHKETEIKGNNWDRKNRPRNEQEVYSENKIRWNLNI